MCPKSKSNYFSYIPRSSSSFSSLAATICCCCIHPFVFRFCLVWIFVPRFRFLPSCVGLCTNSKFLLSSSFYFYIQFVFSVLFMQKCFSSGFIHCFTHAHTALLAYNWQRVFSLGNVPFAFESMVNCTFYFTFASFAFFFNMWQRSMLSSL